MFAGEVNPDDQEIDGKWFSVPSTWRTSDSAKTALLIVFYIEQRL
jgi:hypothetical protein